jgi:hypothetical protein
MALTITQSDIEALLCRPLNSCEQSNFNLYLNNVQSQLIEALCWNPFESFTGVMEFDYTHDNTYYILQPFTNLTKVEISDCDGSDTQDIICDWTPVTKELRYSTNGCFFGLKRCICNACEAKSCCTNKCKRLKITATWGDCHMDDLKLVALKLLEQDIKSSDCSDNIQSKSIRSMTVTYRDTERVDYLSRYSGILNKWSVCNVDIG